ncbi:MAG: hypothetical protein OES09_07660, partial [Gammaproteobacteria bacterium]|nr:hypothetical protein [Gammaproteobacteria bacterium]
GVIQGVDADDDGSVDPLIISVDQSNSEDTNPTEPSNWNFSTTEQNVKLFEIIDDNNNGIIDVDDTSQQVQLNGENSTIQITDGDVQIEYYEALLDAFYVVGVTYSTDAVKGINVGSSRGDFPIVDYTFDTLLGDLDDGDLVQTDPGGITLAPKLNGKHKLVLDGETAEESHAPVLNEASLQPIIEYAIAYWSEHGADADDIAMLREIAFNISDLGDQDDGTVLAEWNSEDLLIMLDDDAAGHGWSTGIGEVNPHKVDLVSAVIHEFGHALEYEHADLGSDLAVGERDLPLDEIDADRDDDAFHFIEDTPVADLNPGLDGYQVDIDSLEPLAEALLEDVASLVDDIHSGVYQISEDAEALGRDKTLTDAETFVFDLG